MSIKQAIEALEELVEYAEEDGFDWSLDNARAALAALRSMPAEPYAYAVYFPDQPTEELVHDLDELLDDMTNREHTVTPLFATPPTEAVRMSEAEIRRWWSSENGFEDLDMCKIDDFRTVVRAVEQATAERLGVKMGDERHADQA